MIDIVYRALTRCQVLLSTFSTVLCLIFTTTIWETYYNFIHFYRGAKLIVILILSFFLTGEVTGSSIKSTGIGIRRPGFYFQFGHYLSLWALTYVFYLNCYTINYYTFWVKEVWRIITSFPEYYFLMVFDCVISCCVCWFGTTPSWKDCMISTSAKSVWRGRINLRG